MLSCILKNDWELKMGKIKKIVYFDEESVTDFVQIVAGGTLEQTSELLNESGGQLNANATASGSVGIGKVFKALLGFEASVSASVDSSASLSTQKLAKSIIKNTILSDFVSMLQNKEETVRRFAGYTIKAERDSLSYIIMVSPYMTMLKANKSIEAGDFNILIDKMENAIKSGKGYYEFIGEKDPLRYVFRFNITSFKNNYRISDILKMDLTVYGIKVGKTTIKQLKINNELNFDSSFSVLKDNPSYIKQDNSNESEDDNIELDIIDVLLAGVEEND